MLTTSDPLDALEHDPDCQTSMPFWPLTTMRALSWPGPDSHCLPASMPIGILLKVRTVCTAATFFAHPAQTMRLSSCAGTATARASGCLPVSGIMDLYHSIPAPGSLEERVYSLVLDNLALRRSDEPYLLDKRQSSASCDKFW